MLLVKEKTTEGDVIRLPHQLSLVRSFNPRVSPSWMALHRIDEIDAIEKIAGAPPS